MSDPVVTNSDAAVDGNTLVFKETQATVTGGIIPASDSVQVGWIMRKQTTLTNAQIKALPTTPITLLAAPGSGLYNNVLSVTYSTDFSLAAYTNINTTYADLRIELLGKGYVAGYVVNDNTNTPVLTDITTIFGNPYQIVYPGERFSLTSGGPINTPNYVRSGDPLGMGRPDRANIAIAVAMDNNGSGVFTGGNAANTMKVTLYYTIEPI